MFRALGAASSPVTATRTAPGAKSARTPASRARGNAP